MGMLGRSWCAFRDELETVKARSVPTQKRYVQGEP